MLPPTYVKGFHNEEAVLKMRYNPLGNTGLMVSHIGFGGGCINAALFGKYERSEVIATIRDAIKNGLNYIDTAPWYGQGASEELLGEALKEVPRDAYYIATKVGRYELQADKMFDFSIEKSKASFEKSLQLLQLTYVDIIQIHDIDYAPPGQIVKDTLPVLEGFVREKKAKFVGITAYDLGTLKETIEKSSVKISTIISYCRDTLIDDSLFEYLPIFKSLGVAVIEAASPCMSLLTNVGPRDWHPANPEVKQICANAAHYCKEHGVELGRLAVHHALSHNGPSTHLIGMPSREIWKSNLDLLNNGLSEKEKSVLNEINARFFSKVPEKHWGDAEKKQFQAKLDALKQKK